MAVVICPSSLTGGRTQEHPGTLRSGMILLGLSWDSPSRTRPEVPSTPSSLCLHTHRPTPTHVTLFCLGNMKAGDLMRDNNTRNTSPLSY